MAKPAPNERIRKLRDTLGKTQKEIADLLAVKVSYYSDIENGRRPVTKKFVDKLKTVISVSDEWIFNGTEGEIPKIVPLNVPFSVSDQSEKFKSFTDKFAPYHMYYSLESKSLDFRLSIEIEALKDAFNDYKKLTEAIHAVKPPAFMVEKFPKFGQANALPSDFSKFRKEIEAEFLETHGHVKDEKQLKVLKIIDLYQSDTEHIRHLMSNLIEYFHNYSDFFLDDDDLKKL